MSRIRNLVGSAISDWVWNCPDDAEFVRRFNRLNRRWRIPFELLHDARRDAFVVASPEGTVTIARRSRLEYYFNGVHAREEQLVREYMLDRVPLEAGDHVIDIGANVGEVSRLLALRHGTVPLAFEPELREFRALEANLAAANGHAWNTLLWSEATQVEFHEANDSGDSSIFPNERAEATVLRDATTLDEALSASPFADAPIRLLKLEAEGAEPQILAGATQTLERTDFVVADVGPERGLSRATTLIAVYEQLREAGFRAVDVQHRRLVLLFSQR